MAKLSPDRQNHLYIQEAARAGIHKPILAALYKAHSQPSLGDGETGLGISPANRIKLEQLNTLPEQIHCAASTIRSLSENLAKEGWAASDLWHAEKGHYTDRFIETVAAGYAPASSDTAAARIEACDSQLLLQAYLEDCSRDCQVADFPQNLDYLEGALLTLVSGISRYYTGLPWQRDALRSAARIWHGLDSGDEWMAKLADKVSPAQAQTEDESYLDRQLLQFIEQIAPKWTGYPHQVEALLRLTQLWRQLDSRESAIVSLRKNTSAETGLKILDPALIAFALRLPRSYSGKGYQRNALTEAVRIWHGLENRTAALVSLGVSAETLKAGKSDPAVLTSAASGLDRELLEFVRRIPAEYKELDSQRQALIGLAQLWRELETFEQAVRSLFDDLKLMNRARAGDPVAPPRPVALVPARPERWTPENIQIHAPILPDGYFTWAQVTGGGAWMPPDQATVDAAIRIAGRLERAQERIGRPIQITCWYSPAGSNAGAGGGTEHSLGDAIEFYCDGLTGNQIYWFLDPWWPGGLGRYTSFPHLCYIDDRNYRCRWVRDR
ncbi:MAG: peptidase M15A [Oscillatoria sp. Prado101]|jgi:hypothetical protein|nr:peptidase M15A [Oscillatoria sp. Prado101]